MIDFGGARLRREYRKVNEAITALQNEYRSRRHATEQDPDLTTEQRKIKLRQLADEGRDRQARLHALRHTQVALLASAGAPAKAVSERLGHHSAGFTLDNYGGTFPAQHQEAAAKLAAMVEG
jgi:integrase